MLRTAQLENQPLVEWSWVMENLGEIGSRTLQHLELTALAVGVGLVISLGLSVVAVRFGRSYTPITAFAATLYAIPSLALFALLVPFTGLTVTTAEIGLVSYTLLILVQNIVAGIRGVPESVSEAARGMGLRSSRVFWGVQLPLALPAVIAGIRIATVTVVGLVTVTSVIGEGGLGFFILDGLNRFFFTEIVVGTVLSVALALALDLALAAAGRIASPWAARRKAKA